MSEVISHSNQPVWSNVWELFTDSSKVQFVIPMYQRDYVWMADNQVDKLLNDLCEVIETKENHFIGILIHYSNSANISKIKEQYVIDGQQRLTTLYLLLFVLLKRAASENKEDAKDSLEDAIYANSKKGASAGYKLEPLINGKNIFLKIVEEKESQLSENEKESALYKAYEYISSFAEEKLSCYDIEELIDGLNRFYLVELPLEKGDNAQQIFESINASGSPLTPSDLIRNFVIMQNEEDDKAFYQNQWIPFENMFPDRRDLETFFRYFLIIKMRKFIRSNAVYFEFKNWFCVCHKEKTTKEIVQDLSNYAFYFSKLFLSSLSEFHQEKLQLSIADYRNVKSTMPAPLAMELTRLYSEKKINADTYAGCLEIIASFVERRAIIGMDTSGISKFFAMVLSDIFLLCQDDYSDLEDVLLYCLINNNRNKASRCPTNEELEENLSRLNVYDFRDALHVFFDKYENRGMAYSSTMNYQIEHIMPQNGSKWFEKLGCTKEEYEKHVNLLGNLTLTTKHDNPEMSNNLFEYKNRIISETAHFKLNLPIANCMKWDFEEIEKRNRALILRFEELYPYRESLNEGKYLAKKNEEKKTKTKDIDLRSYYAREFWPLVTERMERDRIFVAKNQGEKPFYDLSFGMPYHFFLDLHDWKRENLNLGVWFSSAEHPCYDLFANKIDDINDSDHIYVLSGHDDKMRGCIKTKLSFRNITEEQIPDFIDEAIDEVYRIKKITDDILSENPRYLQKIRYPRLDWMIEKGAVSAGDKIYIKGKQEEIGVIREKGMIEYQGNLMSTQAYGTLITGWKHIPFYLYAVHVKTGKTMSELRDEMMEKLAKK